MIFPLEAALLRGREKSVENPNISVHQIALCILLTSEMG
jgi:hypothetical protein